MRDCAFLLDCGVDGVIDELVHVDDAQQLTGATDENVFDWFGQRLFEAGLSVDQKIVLEEHFDRAFEFRLGVVGFGLRFGARLGVLLRLVTLLPPQVL